MKKFLTLLLAFALSFSLAACSGDKAEPTSPTSPSESEVLSEATPTPTAKPTPTPTPEPTPETEPASRIGESVYIGTYEQDNNLENGPEPIEWVIINESDSGYQVVSKYILDFKNYHNKEEDVSWETSDIRAWLNGDFYNDNFTDLEKAEILLTTVDNSEELIVEQEEKAFFDPSRYGYQQGNDTEDYIYLFSEAEIRNMIMTEYRRLVEEKVFTSLNSLSYDIPEPNIRATSYSFRVGVECDIDRHQINEKTGLCTILTRTRTDFDLCRANNNYGELCVYVLNHNSTIGEYDHWRQPFGIQPVMWISK